MTAFADDMPQGEKVFEPSYRRLARTGVLAERARDARLRLRNCDLCARYCHVDRTENIRGAICRTGERAVVYSAGPHHGEEDCLRGVRGSGTISFFLLQSALRLLSKLGHQLAGGRARGLDRRTRRDDAQAAGDRLP
jgi:hypothetical protein